MLQYLIILLDNTSTSYCHYTNPYTERRLISIEDLKAGILLGMKENLMIQFVYPDYRLPVEYEEVIESIDNHKIVSSSCENASLQEKAAVLILRNWEAISACKFKQDKAYALLTSKGDFFVNYSVLKEITAKIARISIVFTDIETFSEDDFDKYRNALELLSLNIEQMYVDGLTPQLNIVTDRMMLNNMNNCGAGTTSITLASNGRFYICPAFYYEDESDNIGDLEHGLDIKNKQLYRLDHAPICRHCDAWQCKRCVWLNRKTTLEVNTPSHEQCVLAHLERNVSRELLNNIRKHGTFLPEQEEIMEIDYLDPFDMRDNW